MAGSVLDRQPPDRVSRASLLAPQRAEFDEPRRHAGGDRVRETNASYKLEWQQRRPDITVPSEMLRGPSVLRFSNWFRRVRFALAGAVLDDWRSNACAGTTGTPRSSRPSVPPPRAVSRWPGSSPEDS